MTVLYFGPDRQDPAVRRRVAQWRHAGFDVLAFAFSRTVRDVDGGTGEGRTDYVDLGRLRPQSRFGRLVSIALACVRLISIPHRRAELIVARNLDNLIVALFARWCWRAKAPVVYEVLDINPACTDTGWTGVVIRAVEKQLLRRIDLLVVSSSRFVSEYFERMLGFRGRWFLFENKVPRYVNAAARQNHQLAPPAGGGRRWRIGWFGYLDDEHSWRLLRGLAEALPDEVEVYVRGAPYTNFDMGRFLQDVSRLPNVRYGGRYDNPADLPAMYAAVDLVWSIDCNNLLTNSKWLLTNSVYEAGYYRVPVLALAGTAVGEMVADERLGWCLGQPTVPDLVTFIRGLDERTYEARRRELMAVDATRFLETDEIARISTILATSSSRETLTLDRTKQASPAG
jgi:succinoglycan biosynthesis protein ExoL